MCAQREIRINGVAPGNIIFPGSTWEDKNKILPEMVRNMLEEKVPLRRLGTTNEVAQLVYFLLSDKAMFSTGSTYPIDGGQTV